MTETAVTTRAVVEGPVSPAARRKFLEAFAGRLGQLTPEQQTQFLMALGQHIGVRAELGEVILFQDKPYVTYDGRVRQATNTGMLIGLDTRPATGIERRDYQVGEGVHLWVALAWRRGADRPFRGWGEAGQKGDRNPVSKDKAPQMARKRARFDALRAAFPVGEDITPMHREMIEAAEQIAAERRMKTHPVLSASYDQIPDEAPDGERGHEEAAGAPAPDNTQVAQSIGDAIIARTPAEPSPALAQRAAAADDPYQGKTESATTAERISHIRRLIAHPACAMQRAAVEEQIARGAYDDPRRALTAIAALEGLVHPPKVDPATGPASTPVAGELALGETTTSRNAIAAGR